MTATAATARRLAVVLAAVLMSACSSDGRELAEPVFPPPPVDTVAPTTVDLLPSEPPDPTLPPPGTEPPATDAPNLAVDRRVVVDRLSSPANATAEAVGTGARPGDTITVDGEEADILRFDVSSDGSFTATVRIEDEGAHTVCIADGCGRVYTLAPDAESDEEVVAKIDEAIVLAAEVLPYADLFPEWTIEIGGAFSGTGGTTDVERRTVVVYRNRGRSVDDFVRTILHELGHVVDAERLDDEARSTYLEAAGYPAGTDWRDPDARRLEDWARQPAEDFAELLVAGWTDRRWLPRTRTDASDDLIAVALELAGFDAP